MKQKIITNFILSLIFVTIFLINPQKIFSQVNNEKIILGERIELHSKVLDENRKIFIRLPKNYNRSKQKFPVLYLLDGEFFFEQASSAVQFLSELEYISNQQVPQMIIVGIVNVDRNRDYTPTYAPKQLGWLEFPTSGKADKFIEFLKLELFPFIEANYRTQPYRILSGWSLGGLFTVYTYLEYSNLFSAYLAISPSLWWDEDLYVKRTKAYLEQNKISNKPITVTVGSLEGGDIGRSVRDGFISQMKSKFGNDRNFKSVEIPEEGHYYVPYKALYEGLKSIYYDWKIPNDLLTGGIKAIESFYNELSKKYGYPIDVPEYAYSNLANYVYNQVSTEAAVEISVLYVDNYTESSFAHYKLGRFLHLADDLNAAKKSYQRAIKFENKTSNPDSERLIMYKINLQKVEKDIKEKKENKNEHKEQ
jgi:hypothetical protein